MRSASEKRVSTSFGLIELHKGGFFLAFRRWREGPEPRENDSSRFESSVTSLKRIAGVGGAVSACSGAGAPSNFAIASMRRLRRPNGTSNSSKSASIRSGGTSASIADFADSFLAFVSRCTQTQYLFVLSPIDDIRATDVGREVQALKGAGQPSRWEEWTASS
jgi:hypothetical protein